MTKLLKVLPALTIVLFSLLSSRSYSQTIVYSEVLKKDTRNSNFEILGTLNGNTLIYKSQNDNHRITVYDVNMKLVEDVKLDFISDKTFNIDFVVHPDYVYAIYQLQQGNNVICNMAKIDANAQLIGNVQPLDTSRVGFFADNKIYYVNASENKERILLYRLQTRNDQMQLSTNVYDKDFVKLDSASLNLDNAQRKEVYSDLQVTNKGDFYFIKQKRKGFSDLMNNAELFYHKIGTDDFVSTKIELNDILTDEMQLKVDNINQLVFANSFTYNSTFGNATGLLCTATDMRTNLEKTRSTITFSDSLRSKITSGRTNKNNPFNNFSITNIIAKRDSGLLITLEESYTDNRGNFNRYGYGYDPYNTFGSQSYYSFQRGYYNNYYNPYNNRFNNNNNIVYNSNDIVMISLDKNLNKQWENIINKKQSDVETNNHLSFTTINRGGALHYIYLLKDNNRQVMSDNALLPGGEIKRYATIKSGEKGFNFMPRLAKQVSSNSIIVPGTYRSSLGFSKIFFD